MQLTGESLVPITSKYIVDLLLYLYEMHLTCNILFAYRTPSNMEPELKDFLSTIFIIDVKQRPSAAECLKMDFLDKYIIPETIPPETFSHPYEMKEQLKDDLSPLVNGILRLYSNSIYQLINFIINSFHSAYFFGTFVCHRPR